MQRSDTRPDYRFRVATVLCAAIGTALWTGPFILRVDLFANDAAQHIFWLYRYADPALFPNDLTARFFSLPSSAPWGYRGLYAAIAPFVDVLFASELIAAGLLLLSVWLSWLIGRVVVPDEHRELGGLIGAVAVLWLVTQHAGVLTPLGLQRCFALPITLLCLWALTARRYFWVGVSWLLAALFYPVIIVVLGLAGAVTLLRDIVRDRKLPALFIWNAIAGVAALAIVILNSTTPPDIGPTLTGSQALARPEFGPHGRVRLFVNTIMGDWVYSPVVGLGWPAKTLLAIAAATGLTFMRRNRARLPAAVWIFLLCGLAVWLVARFTLFELYLPNRHTRWTIAAFGTAVFAPAGVVVVEHISRHVRRRLSSGGTIFSAAISMAAILVVVAAFLPTTLRTWQIPVDRDMERAYAYLATLPRDTLIAAHPDLADFVPLRSKRSVLASTETSLPFMQGYYQRIEPRLQASLRAAYASSWEELDAALAPYGVTVMLTAPSVWSKTDYYEPFAALVASLRSQGERRGFVLKEPSGARVLFRSGGVYVVRVGQELPTSSE